MCSLDTNLHELFELFSGEMTTGKENSCVVVKGSGQSGVQRKLVGTTCFRRLVEKDSCVELEQVRYVLQCDRKYTCVDTTRKGETTILTVSVRVFDVWSRKIICHYYHECEVIVLG
jgi:hypothetical protein